MTKAEKVDPEFSPRKDGNRFEANQCGGIGDQKRRREQCPIGEEGEGEDDAHEGAFWPFWAACSLYSLPHSGRRNREKPQINAERTGEATMEHG